MSLWNVSSASGIFNVPASKHGHFVWLGFNTEQRCFYIKINFLFEFVSSFSKSLIISSVRHVLYGDSPWIQNKEY